MIFSQEEYYALVAAYICALGGRKTPRWAAKILGSRKNYKTKHIVNWISKKKC